MDFHNIINWISYSPRRTVSIIILSFLALVGLLIYSGCAHTPPSPPEIREVIKEVGPTITVVNCHPITMLVLFTSTPEGKTYAQGTDVGCRCTVKVDDRILVDLTSQDPSVCGVTDE